MRKMLKKLTTIFTAGALAVTSAAALAACAGSFTHPSEMPEGEVKSNGGFVVDAGNYVYFVNGVQSYDVDNTYGAPVKGALMRIEKSSIEKHENTAEIVVPSVIYDGNQSAGLSSGISIYGDRVYYTTPNNVSNTSGEVERDYLDFKSAKLDGSDVQSYFNVSDNTTTYRFVEVDGVVYIVYYNSSASEIISYNTSSKTATTLAKDVSGTPLFNKTDKEDPYVYYTMGVIMDIDVVDGESERSYNQIYRVRADATESPYAELNNYEWNEEYLEANDGEIPYRNFGELVLDGIGAMFRDYPTVFSHHAEGLTENDYTTTAGYTYSLQSYDNGGLYFTRTDVTKTNTVGEDGWLYYISAETFGKEGWNSIKGNAKENLDVVAQPTDTTYASASALFYIEEGQHKYIYANSSNLFRAEVDAETGVAEVTRIGQGVGSATLVSLDIASDETYQYAYYTISGTSGNNIYRAVINGDAEDYKTLGYEKNKPYRPVQVLNIQHARSWYEFEIIDGLLYFADAEAIGSNSYNYISYVDLKGESGKLMNNVELSDYDDKLGETVGDDGYLAELTSNDRGKFSTAIKYYFYTGETKHFRDNIAEAVEKTGKANTLYSDEDIAEFDAYVTEAHALRSDFIHDIGLKTEEDAEAIDEYWRTALEHYIEPTVDEEEGATLPAWAWALIGIAIGLIIIGAAVAVWLVLRARSNEESVKEEKMFVDTTDDKSVDVYADETVAPAAEETEQQPAEEAAEEPATDEQPAEEAVEEPATEPEAAPAEESAETPEGDPGESKPE